MEELTVEELAQKAAKLVDWADYQKGSIVSRKIIQKETGSATFFAFDQGQELSTHRAPYDALVYLVDGEAEIQIDEQLHHVSAGQILMLPANRPHAVKAARRFKMLLVMI
ncbi:MAG: cupin domain-containing protein [Elusimicrobiota bacterium]|jgi:quercetin dioxygenase-like cupin family protein